MAETLVLQAQIREESGKGAAKRVRAEGNIPGVYYHAPDENVKLSFNLRELEVLLSHKPRLFEVQWGDEKRECLIREIQRHPVTHTPTHLDLMGITRGVKIDTDIPIKVVGVPVGVRNSGGILQQPMREAAVRCLPKDLPEFLEVNVDGLDIGDSIHLSDLTYDAIEWIDNPKRTVVTVIAPTLVRDTAAADEAEEGEGEELEEGETAEESSEG